MRERVEVAPALSKGATSASCTPQLEFGTDGPASLTALGFLRLTLRDTASCLTATDVVTATVAGPAGIALAPAYETWQATGTTLTGPASTFTAGVFVMATGVTPAAVGGTVTAQAEAARGGTTATLTVTLLAPSASVDHFVPDVFGSDCYFRVPDPLRQGADAFVHAAMSVHDSVRVRVQLDTAAARLGRLVAGSLDGDDLTLPAARLHPRVGDLDDSLCPGGTGVRYVTDGPKDQVAAYNPVSGAVRVGVDGFTFDPAAGAERSFRVGSHDYAISFARDTVYARERVDVHVRPVFADGAPVAPSDTARVQKLFLTQFYDPGTPSGPVALRFGSDPDGAGKTAARSVLAAAATRPGAVPARPATLPRRHWYGPSGALAEMEEAEPSVLSLKSSPRFSAASTAALSGAQSGCPEHYRTTLPGRYEVADSLGLPVDCDEYLRYILRRVPYAVAADGRVGYVADHFEVDTTFAADVMAWTELYGNDPYDPDDVRYGQSEALTVVPAYFRVRTDPDGLADGDTAVVHVGVHPFHRADLARGTSFTVGLSVAEGEGTLVYEQRSGNGWAELSAGLELTGIPYAALDTLLAGRDTTRRVRIVRGAESPPVLALRKGDGGGVAMRAAVAGVDSVFAVEAVRENEPRKRGYREISAPVRLVLLRQDDSEIPLAESDTNHVLMVSRFVTSHEFPGSTGFRSDYASGGPKANAERDLLGTFRPEVSGVPDGEAVDFRIRVRPSDATRTPYDRVWAGAATGMKGGQHTYRSNRFFRLVSDAADDSEEGDQTIMVELEDRVCVVAIVGNVQQQAETCVPVGRPATETSTKSVRRVDISFRTLTGLSSAPWKTAQRMSQAWAQAGVYFSARDSMGYTLQTDNVLRLSARRTTASAAGQLRVGFRWWGTPVSVTVPFAQGDRLDTVASRLRTQVRLAVGNRRAKVAVFSNRSNAKRQLQDLKDAKDILIVLGNDFGVGIDSFSASATGGLILDRFSISRPLLVDMDAHVEVALLNMVSDTSNAVLSIVVIPNGSLVSRRGGYNEPYGKTSNGMGSLAPNKMLLVEQAADADATWALVAAHEAGHALFSPNFPAPNPSGDPRHSSECQDLMYPSYTTSSGGPCPAIPDGRNRTDSPKRISDAQSTSARDFNRFNRNPLLRPQGKTN